MYHKCTVVYCHFCPTSAATFGEVPRVLSYGSRFKVKNSPITKTTTKHTKANMPGESNDVAILRDNVVTGVWTNTLPFEVEEMLKEIKKR